MKTKYIPSSKRPVVGQIVSSNTLNIIHTVVEVKGDTVTLKAKRGDTYNFLFESFAINVSKKMSIKDLNERYYYIEKHDGDEVPVVEFNKDEIAQVPYRCGYVYTHADTAERVMLASIATIETSNEVKEVKLNLVSSDKMFGQEYIAYTIDEDYFKDNFVNDPTQNRLQKFESLSF